MAQCSHGLFDYMLEAVFFAATNPSSVSGFLHSIWSLRPSRRTRQGMLFRISRDAGNNLFFAPNVVNTIYCSKDFGLSLSMSVSSNPGEPA